MNLPAIAVHEFVKHFGDGVAVDNISFSVVRSLSDLTLSGCKSMDID